MIRCDTPESLIAKWDVMRPGIWRDMDTLQATKAVGELDWPDECAIPISAAASVIQKSGTDIITAFRAAAEVTACYLWRKNRVIYQFDHTLAEALWAQANEMDEDEELPVDLLLHLPYPCIYVSTNIVDSFVGFFAWIEWDSNVHRYELRASWKFSSDGGTLAQMLHILPGQTLGQCVEDTMAQAIQNLKYVPPGEMYELPKEITKEAVALSLFAAEVILYINSLEPDIRRSRIGANKQKRNRGKIRPTAKPPVVYDMGVRIGAALRKAAPRSQAPAQTGTGSSKRPHLRRGHWHHYWTGPKSDPASRKLVLKWTPPTAIHPDAATDSRATVIPISRKKEETP